MAHWILISFAWMQLNIVIVHSQKTQIAYMIGQLISPYLRYTFTPEKQNNLCSPILSHSTYRDTAEPKTPDICVWYEGVSSRDSATTTDLQPEYLRYGGREGSGSRWPPTDNRGPWVSRGWSPQLTRLQTGSRVVKTSPSQCSGWTKTLEKSTARLSFDCIPYCKDRSCSRILGSDSLRRYRLAGIGNPVVEIRRS